MVLSYSVPSARQALPTLAGLAQSFFRSQLWCPFFQEASPDPLGGWTDSLWVSQCPGQPLTQTVHGGGSRAAGGGRSSVDAGEREHPPAAQRPGQDTRPQEERSKEHHPSRPPGHLPAPLFQPREISPSGTEGGDVPDGATSTPVSETTEAGSPWLVPCSRSQTWPWACRLSPSEHTFGLHDAKGRSRHTDGKWARTQVRVLGRRCQGRVDVLGQRTTRVGAAGQALGPSPATGQKAIDSVVFWAHN